MVTIQDTELKEGIHEAIQKAHKLSTPVLVSEVQKIHQMEPLSFFRAGKESFFGERFFWKDPSDNIFLVGLGICKQIQTDQDSGRFFHVEKEWKRFTENGLIFNKYKEAATGPIMFGGFSFDPQKTKTDLWSKYSDTLFHIPKYLLTVINNETYLTTNVICTQHDNESLVERIVNERLSLLSFIGKPNFSENTLEKKLEINPEEWKQSVTELVQDLKTGSLKKAVLARELRLVFKDTLSIETIVFNLLKEQPRSFIFAFESNGDCFVGASPERLVKKEGEDLFSTCLAGSIARGDTDNLDEELGNQLLTDEKNLSEHQFVVDMIKEAMEQVCTEVHLPERPALMKMRDIQHLYTPVIGKGSKSSSLLQLVNLLHPTPALGGLPKKEAVEKIREVEELDRGFYASPLGWMDYEGNGEFIVAIRSGLIQGREASLFAGCGVVADSNAESEYQETNIKFRPMLSALGGMDK
ncbi:isochorismate synthase [Bacillus sp. 31A1R]|uniref:Isochorismate synthase MenF n=1 Tax=Robertmurraya mangrovi TaxID=3098077 RepID=A0ABU5IZN9_9BACI|nr:isochorismate synthase [Bacillus sp. 31A1R]MDZ5472628.1 isochorismate synthase [Bacillus sp. 31A1R]